MRSNAHSIPSALLINNLNYVRLTMHLVPRDAECLDPCGPPLMSSSITPAFWATCFSQSSSALSCPGSGYMQSVFIPSWPIAHCSSFDVHAGKGHHSCSRFHRASCLYLGFYFVCSLGPYMCAANSVFQEALYNMKWDENCRCLCPAGSHGIGRREQSHAQKNLGFQHQYWVSHAM